MLKRSHLLRAGLVAPMCLLLLAACGGGGGAGVAPIPAPPAPPPSPPAPTPPPPPPPPQRNTSLPPTVSETFVNRAATSTASLAAGTGLLRGTPSTRLQPLSISYDAGSQSYSVAAPFATQSFGSAQRTGASTATLSSYERRSGNTTDLLLLFNSGPSNPTLALTYVSLGGFARLVDNGAAGIDLAQSFFVYGVPTAVADMPRTGSASYATYVDGFYVSPTVSGGMGGTGSFSADFAAGTVQMRMDLRAQAAVGGTVANLGTLSGQGTISDANFAGSLSGGTQNFSGNFQGLFFGPQAAEMGAAFNVTNGAGTAAGVGAIVGRRN